MWRPMAPVVFFPMWGRHSSLYEQSLDFTTADGAGIEPRFAP